MVDGLPLAASNAPGDKAATFGTNIFMANTGINHDVLGILTSDIDAPLK